MFEVDIDRQKAGQKALERLEKYGKIPSFSPALHFGYTLKTERILRKISMEELAELAYTYHGRISQYESGRRMPNIRNLELLIGAFLKLGANPEVGDILRQAYDETIPHRDKKTVAAAYKTLR